MRNLSALGSVATSFMSNESTTVTVTTTSLPEIDMSPITNMFQEYGEWVMNSGINMITAVAPFVLGFMGAMALFYLGKRLISRIGH